jgi:hypothetical protein
MTLSVYYTQHKRQLPQMTLSTIGSIAKMGLIATQSIKKLSKIGPVAIQSMKI